MSFGLKNDSLVYLIDKSPDCLALEEHGEQSYNDFIKDEADTLESLRKIKLSTEDSNIFQSDINYNEAQRRLYRKGLEYIRLNPTPYFSFWIFRKEICKNPGVGKEQVLKDFENLFSDSLRHSFEGNTTSQIIKDKPLRIKATAPNFVLKDLNSKHTALYDLSNKFILLSFWGPYCGPCIQEIPELITLKNKFKGKGLLIVSIAVNGDKTGLKKAIKKYKMDWIHLVDYESATMDYVKVIPSIFLLNDQKEILYYSQRFIDMDEIVKKIGD